MGLVKRFGLFECELDLTLFHNSESGCLDSRQDLIFVWHGIGFDKGDCALLACENILVCFDDCSAFVPALKRHRLHRL